MKTASIRKSFGLACACLAISVCTLGTSSRDPGTLNTAMQALNTLVQNKTLAEQFVRDIKASIDPSEPVYAQLLESYDEARGFNSRFLDEAEVPASHHTRGIRSRFDTAKRRAEESMVAFLESATQTLRPTVSTRSMELKRIAELPDNLPVLLRNVPKATRGKYMREFDSSVRWRPWNEL